MTKNWHIEAVRGPKGRYSLRILSRNKIVFASETYYTKSNARRAGKRAEQKLGIYFVMPE